MGCHAILPWLWLLLITWSAALAVQVGGGSGLQEAIRRREEAGSAGRTLSRRKRFLTFPEGSSLQLVFCCQTAAVIEIGDIFLYGNTAALAWELPQDPAIFRYIKSDKGSSMRRKDDIRTIYYTDDRGKLLFKVPYKRHPIVNPAFAKRSVRDPFQIQNSASQDENWKPEMHAPEEASVAERKQMHDTQRRRDFLKIEHLDDATVEFHRSSRKGLYEKLEVFLKALGLDGRACLRRVLCEVGARPAGAGERQGDFVQELMRTVFTLPQGREFEKERHREYDVAHRASAAPATPGATPATPATPGATPDDASDATAPSATACEDLYPGCDDYSSEKPIFL